MTFGQRSRVRRLGAAGLTAFGLALAAAIVVLPTGGVHGRKLARSSDSLTRPVPRAECGPADRTESGLQGMTTMAEKFGGLADLGFNCNLELIGHFDGEGASWQMTYFEDCVYYDTANSPQQQIKGTVVVDVSDSRLPEASAYLADAAMIDPWESLKVNPRRKLLAGVQRNGPAFSVYDISADCSQPQLLSTVNVEPPGPTAVRGHAGEFAPDGMTYYGTAVGNSIYPIDISDPRNPKLIARWIPGAEPGTPHDISFSADGTRMYVAQPGSVRTSATLNKPNGLVIVDVSDIQYRRPNPQFRVVSTLFWPDGGVAQQTIPIKIKGKPYLVFTDELGSGGSGGVSASQWACDRGLPPFGFVRLIDISDERNPKVVSKLMLEVHDPANCSTILNDHPSPTITGFNYGYSSHYCNVDTPRDPNLLACSYFEAGLRVFDIRDPGNPKEVAYFKPRARRTEARPGSQYWRQPVADRMADWTPAVPRFVKGKNGSREIWFTSQDNGFHVVRFTNRLELLTGHDFEQDHPGNRN